MPSIQTISAVRIARALSPAEQALNQATLQILAVGTEVLTARTNGGFHPIAGQQAVDGIGRVTNMLFGAMREMAEAHGALKSVAEQHQVLGFGDVIDCPPVNQPRGHDGNVVPITAAA